MAFKRRTGEATVPEDPEQLYRQFALSNNGPEALWSHQADVLRDWHKDHLNLRDVALEPPAEPVEPLPSPLGIVAAFDYLDVVWRLHFSKPLVVPLNGESTARLALSVNTQEVSHGPKEHPYSRYCSNTRKTGGYDDAALDRVRDAVAVLAAVVHVRNAQQHGGGQERGGRSGQHPRPFVPDCQSDACVAGYPEQSHRFAGRATRGNALPSVAIN